MNKLCLCGCGQETKMSWNNKGFNNYINGHSLKGRKKSEETINKRQISRFFGEIRRELNIPFDYMFPFCKCGCGQKVKHKNDIYISNHQPSSKGMIGKKFTKETLEKLSRSHLGIKFENKRKENLSKSMTGDKNPMYGKKFSLEHRSKLKGRIPWNKGKIGNKHSPETRKKMSLSAVNHINSHLRDGKIVRPNIGKNEIPIIDQIENSLNIKGISEDKLLFLKCGKWPDRFYEKYNLVVDVLEPAHFKPTGELSDKDLDREALLACHLGCMIYYIPEQEFLSNPEKEIQRFKDFLVLLDQGVN